MLVNDGIKHKGRGYVSSSDPGCCHGQGEASPWRQRQRRQPQHRGSAVTAATQASSKDGSPVLLLLIFFLSSFLCLVSCFYLLIDGILLLAGKTERCHVTSEQSSPLNHPRGTDMGFTFSGHF
ncbi:hypothetical protein Q7C36_010021 [Tachysurus vachellii]|uniref:Uncharacterized protein n=1 Tax=Tachysurus vachellii TaxID=175792 RepID=A0AA88SSK3_TACVA|nr:hypothetical protein Q7C36_010021 [Tachysurus vachellii]